MNNKKTGMRTSFGSSCLLTTVMLIGSAFYTQIANAVPAFARQTDVPCAGCHFQNFPALNGFGRNFRANGYTLMGSQKKIEGDEISLPATLNASIITKLRYEVQGSDDRGEIQWPDEAAILVGGRLSEHAGFLMELGMGPQEAEVNVDTGTGTITGDTNGNGIMDPTETWVVDTGTGTGGGGVTGNFLSTKLHFNVTDNFAVIPYSTDGLGVGYGFELLNTGVQRSQRPIENRKGFSAGQMLGTASGGATGLAFVYHTDDWFLNYSHWAPTWGNVDVNVVGGMAHYLRAAYMPSIGGWDVGVGFSMMSGTIDVGDVDPPVGKIMVDSWGVDAQAQGSVGNMPLGIYLSYGVAPKGTSSVAFDENTNIYNTSTIDDATALGMVAKLGVDPGKTQVYLGYGSLDKNAKSVADITIGVQHMVDQNIKLELYNVSSDAVDSTGSDDKSKDYTMLMLFAGF